MKQPNISAVIAAYQASAFIGSCVDSLLRQEFDGLEIVIVDDGSTDGTGEICDRIAAREPCVRVIHQENAGPAAARNAGLAAARGDYISFADADDVLLPGAYDRLWAIAEQYKPDLIRFGCLRREQGKQPAVWNLPYSQGLYEKSDLAPIRLDTISYSRMLDYGKRRIHAPWSNLCRRKWLEEQNITFRSEREILNEDYLFVLQAVWAAEKIYMLPEPLYGYQIRPGSLSRAPQPRMYAQKKALFEAYRAALPQNDPQVEQRLRNFYIDGIYCCVTQACQYMPAGQAVAYIRQVLRDHYLQACLEENRALATGLKTRCIWFLMKHRLAGAMYRLYRLCRR